MGHEKKIPLPQQVCLQEFAEFNSFWNENHDTASNITAFIEELPNFCRYGSDKVTTQLERTASQ